MPNVIADSSVLVEFFRPNGAVDVREEIGRLLEQNRLAVCGIVISELFQGVRTEEQQPLRDFFKDVQYLELSRLDFEAAGESCNSLRKKGQKIPITDALIACLCIRSKLPLYTLDSHFDQFKELALHQPYGKTGKYP